VTAALLRVHAGRASTFVAIHAEETELVLARIGQAFADLTGCDPAAIAAAAVPWDTLGGPGIRAIAAAQLATGGPRTIVFLGTAAGGQWVTWHVPAPAPDPAPR
jgi:hypothetical protein